MKKTAKDTWNKLKSIHERSNLSSKLFLLRKLYSAKMPEDGNMIHHINYMLELVDKLKAVGEDIKDDHIAALLLVSVPKSYDHLISALEAREEKYLTPQLIRDKLTDEYNRRKEQNIDRNSTQAFKTNAKFNSSNFRKYPKKDSLFCTYCKRSSHIINQCYFLENKNKSNNYRKFNPKTENKQNQSAEKSSVCFTVNSDSETLLETNKELKSICVESKPHKEPQLTSFFSSLPVRLSGVHHIRT